MHNVVRFAAIAATLPFLCGMAAAGAELTKEQNRAAVDAIAVLVTKDYVFPDRRAAIVDELKKREAEGRYDIANPAAFAQAVDEDMVALSHDGHMWFKYDPDEYKAAGSPAANRPDNAYEQAIAARTNQGFTSERILPGNIRYVNVAGFEWSGAATSKVIADVARFLSGGDAIIIDLSGNGGGAAQGVQALISYFLPPDGRTLMTFHDSISGQQQATHVINKLAGPRLTGKPLYVLISGATGSAAEEFAYHVKNFKLGTLVGTKTYGAGNNDTLFPVAPFFVQSISTGRPVHPVTNTNWDGVGVPPDVTAPRAHSLAQAQVLALQSLIDKGPADHRTDYQWALTAAQADLNPVHPKADDLAKFAGTYGDRKIWLEDGALMYQRPGREATTLTPLTGDLFAFGNTAEGRAKFHREGDKITGFDYVSSDGQTISNPRS